ncbi:MAG TPA: SDR family NAD(P)-dependent oxidoreductase [Vicinamibacterales bacterium]|jgi:NAD(P)-dependent dehydrogenase (short-subunit alcohol dehydrogenase family)
MAFGVKKATPIAWRRVNASSLDLKGLNVAVVGGTGGLGRALSRQMASRGAHVIVVGQTFRDAGLSGIEFLKADLSMMREAKRVGAALPAETLDIVIFTTGIFAGPKRETTADGIERDLAVSYLNRLVILNEIAPRLGRRRTGARLKPRVFVMGFPGTGQTGTVDDLNAEQSYKAMSVHMNTVAGNEVLVLDAAQRYPRVAVFGLNPGLHKTDIRNNLFGDTLKSRFMEWMIGLFTSSPETYAARTVPLVVSPDLEAHSGAMFDQHGNAIVPTPKLTNASYRQAFLAASTALVTRGGVRLS